MPPSLTSLTPAMTEPDPAARAQAALAGEYSREAARKQAFQRYLEQHKVMDALNTAVQELYRQPAEELPADPLAFICSRLAGRPGPAQQ